MKNIQMTGVQGLPAALGSSACQAAVLAGKLRLTPFALDMAAAVQAPAGSEPTPREVV